LLQAQKAALDCLEIVETILLIWGVHLIHDVEEAARYVALGYGRDAMDDANDERADDEHANSNQCWKQAETEGRVYCCELLDELAAKYPAWEAAINAVSSRLTRERPTGPLVLGPWAAENAHELTLDIACRILDLWYSARLTAIARGQPCDSGETEAAMSRPVDPEDKVVWRLARRSAQRESLPPLDRLRVEIASEVAQTAKEELPADDDSAFRPASEFLDPSRVPDYKRLQRILRANPWIRTRKPSPQRLQIHAGDWHDCLSRLDAAGFDALDARPELVADFLNEAGNRQEEVRRRKSGK
jgi:hypothetical protein